MTLNWKPDRSRTLLGAALMTAAMTLPAAAQTVAPITIVINQSPWFESFSKTVQAYEEETGNKVELDVNPFAGSLEKQRNSVRAAEGSYDILIINSGWFNEMYAGGFLTPITDIDPDFKLDPDLYTLNDTIYWNDETKTVTADGKLMTVPIQPNIPMLFYRGDLYEEAGLEPPTTFAELEANAKRFNNPPEMYGIVQRGARGPASVSYDFYPYLYGYGASIFADQSSGDYDVTLNSPEALQALEYWVRLAKEAGHPQTAAMDQAEVIQAMLTGKAAHIITVIAAWPQMDDPNKSIVVDKVEWAPPPSKEGLPSAPPLGHWLGGVSRNVPDDRKAAAVEFLRWFQTEHAQHINAEAGGIPVNAAVYEEPIAEEHRFRWMKPLSEALPDAINIYQISEAAEVVAVLELGLNQAVAGEIAPKEALNRMAGEIAGIMHDAGYESEALPALE